MNQRRIESFLLRIIVEERPGCAPGEWRGRVQHVGSGIEEQFESLHDLMRFVGAQITTDEQAMFRPAVAPTVSRPL